jgi:hypothetical protein
VRHRTEVADPGWAVVLSLDPPIGTAEFGSPIHQKGLLSWDNDGVLRRRVAQLGRHFQWRQYRT